MNEKWSHKSILGFTDDETVMLEFDNMPFKQVKYWAFRAMRWFKLKCFIILKSSEKCYHVVFDRKVSWVFPLSKHKKLTGWFIMQCILMGLPRGFYFKGLS